MPSEVTLTTTDRLPQNLFSQQQNTSVKGTSQDEDATTHLLPTINFLRFEVHGIVIDLEEEGAVSLLRRAYEEFFTDLRRDNP